jgi:hypothetical protein
MALISYWKFEDLTDEEGLHNITNVGADQVTDGYDFEQAYSEYMKVTDSGDDYDFGANEAFTIVVWAKLVNDSDYHRIISKYDGTYGYEIVVWNTGKIRLGMKSTGTYRYVETANAHWGDGYHMIAARRVASSTTIRIWVDDSDKVNGTGYSGTLANALDLHIGRYAASSTSFLDGEIGNTNGGKSSMGIQIYDTELSDAELTALYASGGWSGKYLGITNPASVNGVAKNDINKVDGQVSL